jgi:hypothetical protein
MKGPDAARTLKVRRTMIAPHQQEWQTRKEHYEKALCRNSICNVPDRICTGRPGAGLQQLE